MERKLVLISVMVILLMSLLSVAIRIQKVQSDEIMGNDASALMALQSDMPVVHVDPQNMIADIGETFTIYLKIFNLSNNFHVTDEQWEYGEPLGPPGVRNNYSLGGLFGLDIQLQWDPTVLDYVEHTVTMPVETYPEGLLHAAPEIVDVKDEVNVEAGTYWLAKSSQAPADAFDRPDENSTAFSMTFTVLKQGVSELNITNADLVIPLSYLEYIEANADIPHWRVNGFFQTPELATRIRSLTVNPFDNETLFTLPVISGESAFINSTIINDGNITDTYNLTLHWGPTLLDSWLNETLGPGEQQIYNYTIKSADLSLGNHSIFADVTSVQLSNRNLTDYVVKNFVVIEVPHLVINGPTSGITGDTLSFNSFNSSHGDPQGEIFNYTWTLTYTLETKPRIQQYGETATFTISKDWPGGRWLVALEVKDNYGVEYDKDRPATASYRTEHLLTLTALPTPILITDISPSIGSSRAFIYLSGDGASPYGEVELYFNEVYITTISANTWGEWSATFMVPVVSSGQYTVQVIDVASDTADAIIFTVLQGPTLRVYPGEAAIGSKISIFGENFQQFTGLYLSFEDLMFFSIITVGEDGTFNATFIVPAVNSGDYVIKVLGMSYYPGGSQIYPEASITVTKGLDTLFNEIEDLENALNELRDECNYNYNYSNYNYNYNYNSNCNHSSTEAPSLNEPTLEGETNVAQSSASLSEMDDLQNDGQVEILDSIENMIFEAKIIAITTILIVVATCILTAIVLSKRK